MPLHKCLPLASLLTCLLLSLLPGAAQIPPVKPDTLAPKVQGTGGCSAEPSASLCEEANRKIIANALGPSPLEENLRRLTDEIGGRMTGSPAMSRAVAWGVAAFRAAGVDAVHTEKYTIPLTWSEGATRLEVLSPAPFPVRLVSLGWSPPTPAAGLEANVVDVGEAGETDFARAGGAARGAILLVHSEIGKAWEDLFNDYLRAPGIIDRAVKSGARAILWMSTRERGLLYRHQNSLVTGELDRLPQAIVAREDAERLARFLAAGHAVRVRLTMPNQVGAPVEQENVVAEIRGREKPDEFVLLGAHLDSWELGTGALDNGCNAALVVEAARAIEATGLRPRRTIRFVLFSGEEQGTLGSWAYVRAHRAELDRAVAVVVYDAGIGRVTGYSLGGRKDIEAAVREALEPAKSLDATALTFDADIGTDNFDFLLEGVPTLIANQEPANYMLNYHAASDTFDKVDIVELKRHVAIAAITAFAVADLPQRLGKRQSRAEIEALMKETGLDQQMQLTGFTPLWQTGARGRQP
jgi:carboxypeptidase Q